MSKREMDEPRDKQVALHPKISVMVIAAITDLADKKGSSQHAINKYLNANYNVDTKKKLSVYIKKYLKRAVEEGELLQPTGKGATGSFKINKQKLSTEPKVLKVKSSKQPKLVTSTPKRTLKPKKAFTSGKSLVKRENSVVDEEVGTDETSTESNKKMPKKTKNPSRDKIGKSNVTIRVKVQKPVKLMASKIKEPKVDITLEEKIDTTTIVPKRKKYNGSPYPKIKEPKVDFTPETKLDTTAIIPKLKKYNGSPYPRTKKRAKQAKSAVSVAKTAMYTKYSSKIK